jgi:hypothetical protein
MSQPMPFDLWCSIAAETVELDAEALLDLLEARGVEPEVWQEQNERWLRALVADVLARKHELTAIYGARCARVLERRRHPALAGTPAPSAETTAEIPANLTERTLPFRKGAPAGLPVPSAPALPGAGSGTGIADLRACFAAALPFQADPAPPGPLSLERFAALIVELEVAPPERARTLARFGVADEAGLIELQRQWNQQLDASPELEERWTQALHAQRMINRR